MDCLLEFTSRSSEISQDFFPPIELSPELSHMVGLYSLSTYNALTNVTKDVNDSIIFHKLNSNNPKPDDKEKTKSKDETSITLEIPPGGYEISALGKYIEEKVKNNGIRFHLTVNPVTMKVEMRCDHTVEFPLNSIRSILGFEKEVYQPGLHISEGIPLITGINIINVDCNIATGSYRNGKKSQTLYSFYPAAPIGYKLIEKPTNILFLPLTTLEISNISLRLTDQHGKLISLNGEEVTIHLVLRTM